MKKQVGIGLLVAAAALAGCSSSASSQTGATAAKVTATESDSGGTVDVAAGEDVVVRVRDHGDGGYVWSILSNGGLGGGAKTREAGVPGRMGDFGTDVFTFSTEGVAAGTYVIQLVDKRSFGDDPGTSYTLTVRVAGGGPPDAGPVTATEADDESSVDVAAGESLAVRLRDHGDGGYVWSVSDDGGLGAAVETRIAGGGALGDFGSDVFTFSTADVAPGGYTIVLVERRPFGNDPGTTYTLTVVVYGNEP